MFKQGHKKIGGRTAGVPNGERKELYNLLHEKFPNYHPVIAMAIIANDPINDIELKFQAHKEVAKYVCPQLKAVEVTGMGGEAMEIRVVYDDYTSKATSQGATEDTGSGQAV